MISSDALMPALAHFEMSDQLLGSASKQLEHALAEPTFFQRLVGKRMPSEEEKSQLLTGAARDLHVAIRQSEAGVAALGAGYGAVEGARLIGLSAPSMALRHIDLAHAPRDFPRSAPEAADKVAGYRRDVAQLARHVMEHASANDTSTEMTSVIHEMTKLRESLQLEMGAAHETRQAALSSLQL
jgi:hypothetical protein